MDVCLVIENKEVWTTAYFIDKIHKYRVYKCNINGGIYIMGSNIKYTTQTYKNKCISDDNIIIFDTFKLHMYHIISIFNRLEYKELEE